MKPEQTLSNLKNKFERSKTRIYFSRIIRYRNERKLLDGMCNTRLVFLNNINLRPIQTH